MTSLTGLAFPEVQMRVATLVDTGEGAHPLPKPNFTESLVMKLVVAAISMLAGTYGK
jgi:hypothetical protein